MKLIEKDKRDKVRVVVGKAVHGKSGVSKPTKTILISDSNVEEVYEKIKEGLKNEK